jgi:hypothetical protein
MPDNLAVDFGFYFTGPIGSTIHEIYQDLLGLTGQRFTEQLVTFKSFDPILQIRSRCDGIDLRDKDNIILYEFKTKNNLPSKPYPEELLQNLLSVILYNAEYELNIRGSSMVYISRNDPLNNVVFFNYDFADPTNSPNPLDMKKELAPLMNKISEILQSIESKTVPSKDSKHIKKFAYGKPTCPICVYRTYCEKE